MRKSEKNEKSKICNFCNSSNDKYYNAFIEIYEKFDKIINDNINFQNYLLDNAKESSELMSNLISSNKTITKDENFLDELYVNKFDNKEFLYKDLKLDLIKKRNSLTLNKSLSTISNSDTASTSINNLSKNSSNVTYLLINQF